MRYLLLILAVASLTACASSKRIIIDDQGVDQAAYERDLADCEHIAAQVSTGGDAAEGAVGGAIIGGALGAIFGNRSTAARGAGGGAVIGGAGRAGDAEQEKRRVMRNCMTGRGYRVLN